jgi:hypothetical protein
MGLDIYGHSDPHLHSPCPVCGYARRYKQWPTRCACNRDCSKEELWASESVTRASASTPS